jgi:hypothetical protein
MSARTIRMIDCLVRLHNMAGLIESNKHSLELVRDCPETPTWYPEDIINENLALKKKMERVRRNTCMMISRMSKEEVTLVNRKYPCQILAELREFDIHFPGLDLAGEVIR